MKLIRDFLVFSFFLKMFFHLPIFYYFFHFLLNFLVVLKISHVTLMVFFFLSLLNLVFIEEFYF